MRKIYCSLFALATMLLVTTSCSQEEDFVQETSNEKTTFSVSLNGKAGSRAIGDGTTAKVLHYEVYRGNERILNEEKTITNDRTITVEMPLLKGEEYDIVFWAQSNDCSIYDVTDLKSIEVKYETATLTSNQEVYDAFYNALEGFEADGKSHTIELRRPFAQLNLGTDDWEKAKEGLTNTEGDPITKTSVLVTGLADVFNPMTGKASASEDITAEFALSNIPEGTFEANGKNYKYLSLNYLLIPGEKKPHGEAPYQESNRDDDKSNVDITFYLHRSTNELFTIEVPNAPVQRNWRTNVVGSLLTGSKFEIVINPETDGEYNTSDILSEALKKGGELKLTSNYVVEAPIDVPEGVTVTLDLNGYEIVGTTGVDANGKRVHVIRNYGTLNIKGGTIASKGVNGGSAIYNEGTMTVENVTLKGAPFGTSGNPSYAINSNGGSMTLENVMITAQHGAVCAYNEGKITLNNVTATMGLNGKTHAVIYTYDKGQVIVNSGTYTNEATDQNSTGASAINGNVVVYEGNINGRIENYYGIPDLRGGTYSVKPQEKYINETCELKDNGNDTWTVTPSIVDSDALLQAIKDGKTNIVLATGNYVMPDGSDLSLQNKTLTISGGKDVILDVTCIDERDQFVTGATLTFEGVTLNFGKVNYMGFANTASLTYKNCTINDLQFLYGEGPVTFENCSLNSNGAEHCVWTWGGQNVSFTDCDFTYSDRAVNCYGENVTTNATFTNCTFTKVAGTTTKGAIETNSSALTALNLTINNCTVNEGDLWWISEWDSKNGANTKVVIDGNPIVLSKAQFDDAIANAVEGSTIILATDVDYGNTQLAINKAIVLDLNGKELTTNNAWGGISLKNGASIKNGTVNHTAATAAIKVQGSIASIEDVNINITPITGKTITGIQIVNGGKSVESLKNITIKGATQGIEIKDCTPNNATAPTVGVIENVKIDATTVGMIVNGWIGKVTNCEIKGGEYGINMLLKGEYKVYLNLVDCTLVGGTSGLWAHDEKGIPNTNNCSLTLTYDTKTSIDKEIIWDFEDECKSVVTLNSPTNN